MDYTYQVWLLTDDLDVAYNNNQKIIEEQLIETEKEDVAVWFAENYEVKGKENCVVRVEKVVSYEDEDCCEDIVYERHIEEE